MSMVSTRINSTAIVADQDSSRNNPKNTTGSLFIIHDLPETVLDGLISNNPRLDFAVQNMVRAQRSLFCRKVCSEPNYNFSAIRNSNVRLKLITKEEELRNQLNTVILPHAFRSSVRTLQDISTAFKFHIARSFIEHVGESKSPFRFLFKMANSSGTSAIQDVGRSSSKTQPYFEGSSLILVMSPSHWFRMHSPAVNGDSQFYIGSVTKHMTAYMLLFILHEIYPNADVENLLNEKLTVLFSNSLLLKKINRAWLNDISLLELLTHRSGLTDYLEAFNDGSQKPEALNASIDPAAILQAVSFDPEKRYSYSNSNYFLIATLIEELSGSTLDIIFERAIKQPAKMDFSFSPISGNYFAFKEMKTFANLVPNLNNSVFIDMANAVGAGNIISTATDLMKWGEYLFKKAPRFIVDMMLKQYGEDTEGDAINLGLGVMDTFLGPVIGHQGNLDSYCSFFGYAPTSETLILILSNHSKDYEKLMESMNEWLSQPTQTVLEY